MFNHHLFPILPRYPSVFQSVCFTLVCQFIVSPLGFLPFLSAFCFWLIVFTQNIRLHCLRSWEKELIPVCSSFFGFIYSKNEANWKWSKETYLYAAAPARVVRLLLCLYCQKWPQIVRQTSSSQRFSSLASFESFEITGHYNAIENNEISHWLEHLA